MNIIGQSSRSKKEARGQQLSGWLTVE